MAKEISDDTLQREYIKLISSNNRELEKAVKEKVKHIQDMQEQIILGMANVVESRDYNTGGHVKRTSDVVKILLIIIMKNIMEKDIQNI